MTITTEQILKLSKSKGIQEDFDTWKKGLSSFDTCINALELTECDQPGFCTVARLADGTFNFTFFMRSLHCALSPSNAPSEATRSAKHTTKRARKH